MKILTIVGARPQFIKASPVGRAILNEPDITEVLVHTGQHFDKNMSDVFFAELELSKPNYHLGVGGGSHAENTGRMLEKIEKVLKLELPDYVLVYGDTDSTLAGALCAAKLNLPLAHVESGLRSYNRRMPEEINRILTDHASDLLFAPTEAAVQNLAIEGISGAKVHMVGDVMFDACLHYRERRKKPVSLDFADESTFVLCTIHRAENTDDEEKIEAIFSRLNDLSRTVPVVMPMHPRTQAALSDSLRKSLNPALMIMPPVGFLEMSWLLSQAQLVVTDSGGLQKEAFFYGKYCITVRDETEWVELIDSGYNTLFNPSTQSLTEIIKDLEPYELKKLPPLYGLGDAANKIVEVLKRHV